ncbi:MAG: permease [Candidatus Omnitrophica bacterium]|nr:permease [Candidatus Omnitrophota bacterium]
MLQVIADWLVYSVLRMDPQSKLAEIINFFIYDTLKILILLFVMISVIGFLRTFIPPEKVRQWLVRKKGFGNILAASFGAVTPFCSCSSIPIFLSFLKARIPLGIAFSFLITSPLINEYLVVLMIGFFGWKITGLYVISGFSIGVISGIILGRMNLEKHLADDIFKAVSQDVTGPEYRTLRERIAYGFREARDIVKKVWLWVVVGVGIGALIHNYVPRETIQGIISKTGVASVPLAAVLGVPMYGSCAAIIPIAVVLFKKGIPLGTALAFMMATAALSLPEAVVLRRAMRLRLILIFFGVTTSGIILTGYIFNFLQVIIL